MNGIEPFIMMGLNAVANLADNEAGAIADKLGAEIKDAVDGSKTNLDNYARDRMVNFLNRLIAAAQ